MSIDQALQPYRNIFLDTAPVIYFVENHPVFYRACHAIFARIQLGKCTAVTSPITLAECIIHPIRLNRPDLQFQYTTAITKGTNTRFVGTNEEIAVHAAELRTRYTLTLTDALQLATALHAKCDAFVTNDIRLKRVAEISFLVISEF